MSDSDTGSSCDEYQSCDGNHYESCREGRHLYKECTRFQCLGCTLRLCEACCYNDNHLKCDNCNNFVCVDCVRQIRMSRKRNKQIIQTLTRIFISDLSKLVCQYLSTDTLDIKHYSFCLMYLCVNCAKLYLDPQSTVKC